MNPLRHVLLLVQSAVCGLVAVGDFVFWLGSHAPALCLLAIVSSVLALLPVVVATGLAARWGWAIGLGITYELLLLLSGVADTFVLRNEDVVSTAVNVVLPASLLWLLLRRPYLRGESPLEAVVPGDPGRRHPPVLRGESPLEAVDPGNPGRRHPLVALPPTMDGWSSAASPVGSTRS